MEAVPVVCDELPSMLFPSDHIHRCPNGSMALAAATHCALARLLPPWHGAPSHHNVPFLCWGQRYGAAWQEDSTFSSCLQAGSVPQSTVGIRKFLKLETDFWVCAVPDKLHPASLGKAASACYPPVTLCLLRHQHQVNLGNFILLGTGPLFL